MPQKKTTKKTAKKKPVKRHEANNKTQKSNATVESYLNTLEDERRADCEQLTQIMRSITKDDGTMWGGSIVGFGHTHLVYESGREMDWFLVGFSSRKSGLSVYIMGENETREKLLAELGPHKMGKGCLTIKRLGDIHLPTLKKLVRESAKVMKKTSRQ